MKLKTTLTTLLLLVTVGCYAESFNIAKAEATIMILTFIVILLLVMGGVILYYNRIISQRNEKLRRILHGLEAYRNMMNDAHPIVEKEKKKQNAKERKGNGPTKEMASDSGQQFFVEMDRRMTNEKPFTDPDFDHQALIRFLGVTQDTFYKMIPRYSNPKNTDSYINSRRAEYGARIIMEHTDYKMDDIAIRCGFSNTTEFTNAFKFAFGTTPTDYLNSMNRMFKS